jgi:hypothetical protein
MMIRAKTIPSTIGVGFTVRTKEYIDLGFTVRILNIRRLVDLITADCSYTGGSCLLAGLTSTPLAAEDATCDDQDHN